MILAVLLVASGTSAAEVEWASRVDEVFADFDSTATPGCALGVMNDGELTYGRGYGMANLEHGVPIDIGTVFRLASVSKQFTAMAILLLERADKLSIDDDVRKFIPELEESSPVVTVRELLSHTSGIRDYLTLTWLAGYRDEAHYTDDDVLDLLARQQATDFEPGSRYSYSNSGYFLLSQIVARVTGSSLKEYASAAMFAPLGMVNTHFHDDNSHLVPRRAAGYRAAEHGGYAIDQTTLEMVGDGGIFTSIEDIVRWDQEFLAPRTVDRALIERMQTIPALTGEGETHYALGLSVDEYKGLKRVHHGGAFVGYRAYLARFPGEDTAIAVFCNIASASPTRLAMKVADIVLEDKLLAEPELDGVPGEATTSDATGGESEPGDFTEWVGAYREVEQGFVARARLDGTVLTLVFPWGETVALAPLGGSLFVEQEDAEGPRFRFAADGLQMVRPGRDPVHYVRVEIDVDRDLSAYVGRYYSAEVDTTYRVVETDEGLRLENADSRRKAPLDSVLEPTTRDAFQLEHLPIEFERIEERVAGFPAERRTGQESVLRAPVGAIRRPARAVPMARLVRTRTGWPSAHGAYGCRSASCRARENAPAGSRRSIPRRRRDRSRRR